MGLNSAYTPAALEFGQYVVLQNMYSYAEGELTVRRGFGIMDSAALPAGSAILGFRRLNDSINNFSTYVVKAANGKLYVTISSTDHITTTTPFKFQDTLLAGSTDFGSIVIERPPLSSGVFAYVGDRTSMYKIGSTSSGAIITKNIGITRPTGPPTFTQGTGGALTALGTYYYTYTLYDKNTGTESLYAVTSGATITLTGANNRVNMTVPTETVDAATTTVRIYRSGTDTSIGFLRVSDDTANFNYTGPTITITDTQISASDIAIASATPLNTVSDKPFSTTSTDGSIHAGTALPYLFGPYLGYILGVGDPKNPGLLYWTDKFAPDMENPANNVEVSSPQDPLMNGIIYDGKPYVFSKDNLFALYVGISDSTFTPSPTSNGRGLWAPHALAVGPQIYFLSNDGIYATSGGIASSLTDDYLRPLFDPDNPAQTTAPYTINGIGVVDYTQPSYMFMAFYKMEVWFQYLGKDGNTHALIYHIRYNRWRHLRGGFGVNIRSMYSDEQTTANLLLGGQDGNLYQDSSSSSDGGVAIASEVKTGLITLGSPLIHKEFGAIILDINPLGATVNIKVYTNRGSTVIDNGGGITATTNAATRTRLFISLAVSGSGDCFSEDLQMDISWSSATVAPILYGYELLYRPEVPQLSRWAETGVTFGLNGWMILRSGYIALRSDGTVRMMIIDNLGNHYNYDIPSTSGGKAKQYIPFDPIKGKYFTVSLALNTATYFRVYPEDCEFQVKPWISSLGYNTVNPFGGNSSSNQSDAINQPGVSNISGDYGSGGSGGSGGGSGNSLGGGLGGDNSSFAGGPSKDAPPADAAGEWQDWGSGRWGYGPPPGGPINIPTGGGPSNDY